MPRAVTPLNDTQIKNAKPEEKDYVISDGGGLQLRVRAGSGSKLWNFNYLHPVTRKRLNMGLGMYPEVGLKQARGLAEEARAKVAEGIDPKLSRDESIRTQRTEQESTLRKVAEDWFEIKKTKVTDDYGDDIWRSLELHVFPDLGKKPINEITAPMFIQVLKPIEKSGRLETVKRVIQRVNEIMVFATNTGVIQANPLAGVKAAFQSPKKQHLPTIGKDELPVFLDKLQNASLSMVTRHLIKWQLLTMVRPSEAAGARWEEINRLENGEVNWVIPTERMKKRRQHIVPLPTQAIRVLEKMKEISGNREHIFISMKNPKTHVNSQTANMAIRRMDYKDKLVSHGLRALASTILNEEGKDPDLIEYALAHTDPNQVRSAYNRALYLERRRELMQWWGDYLDEAVRAGI